MRISEAYDVLGIPQGASPDAVKAAYRREAMRHHPDRNADDPEAAAAFLRIREAYDALTGKAQRNAGDGRSKGTKPTRPVRGADQTVVMETTLERALRGGRVTVRADAASPCATCDGSGRARLPEPERCDGCGGTGTIERARGLFRVRVKCPICDGGGWLSARHCDACEGSGRNPMAGDVEFDLPAGVADGDVVTLEGLGGVGRNGGRSGDLHVVVRVAPHPRFRRRGIDLLTQQRVSFADLCLGGPVSVATLDGDDVAATVSPGTPSGSILTIPGRGMPDGSGGRGKLLVRVQAAVPSELTPEQRAVAERWKALEAPG